MIPFQKVFNSGELSISAEWSKNNVIIVLQGVSDSRSPGPFFERVIEEVLSFPGFQRVTVDFRPLGYMNSATVSAIMRWVKVFETMKVATVLRFDGQIAWQRVHMLCLIAAAKSLKHIQIEG